MGEYSEELRLDIVREYAVNPNFEDIAKKHKISPGGVSYTIKRADLHGTVKDLPRSGRPPIISSRVAHEVCRALVRGTLATIADCIQWLKKNYRLTASRQTVTRTLKDHDFYGYVQVHKPFLSPSQISKRFEIAQKWRARSNSAWCNTIFSDEKIFHQANGKHKSFIYLPRGWPFDSRRMVPTLPFGGASIRIWAAISPNGIIAWKIYEGSLNAQSYIDILSTELLPAVNKALGEQAQWTFQQDGAGFHTAKLTKRFFKKKNISVLDWPARSPDLNLIENVWSKIDAELDKLPMAKDKNELQHQIAQIIHDLNKRKNRKYFLNLYNSMPKRIEEVIQSGGLPTRH